MIIQTQILTIQMLTTIIILNNMTEEIKIIKLIIKINKKASKQRKIKLILLIFEMTILFMLMKII